MNKRRFGIGKSIVALLLAALMVVSLAACGGGGGGGATTTAGAAATTAAPAATTAAAAAEATTAAAADATTAAAAATTAAPAATTAAAAAATTAAAASGGTASDLPYVELTFYMMGEVGEDMDQFYSIFDEWTLRDFNCIVRFKHCNTWVDYAAKYNLMLTADDTIDLCYSASWVNYSSYAKKDAYMPLNDLLPTYCPNIWSRFPADLWNGVTINGNIYGVPQFAANYHGEFFWYREDMRKKYDLPDMSSLDLDLIENYMKTVLENESDFRFAVTYLYTNLNGMFNAGLTNTTGIDATALCMRSLRDDPKTTILFYEDPGYLEFAQRMKRWADLGFWSKSVLATADDTDHTDLWDEGVIFVSNYSHLDRGQGIPEILLKNHPGSGWEVGFIPWASKAGYYYNTRTTQDLTCIPNGSKNPERALMVFDKMMTDRDYYDLCLYGMEGLNYEFDESGAVSYVNIDTKAHRFDLCLWALRNDDLKYPTTRLWDGRTKWEEEFYPKLQYDPFDGIALEVDNVQSEFAAITQVIEEYGRPIEWGLVADPAAALENYKQRMKEAGMDRFKADMDRQIAEFIDAKK